MKSEYLQLKAEREIGDILSDTFKFVKLNLKPLLKVLVKSAAAPFVIVLLASTVVTLFQPEDQTNLFTYSAPQLITFGINFIASLILYLLMTSAVLHYMSAYAGHAPKLDLHLISKNAKGSAMYLLGYGVIAAILIFLGMMLFILPGIYLFVPLSIGYVILIFERKTISTSLSMAFKIISGEWWVTFGTLIVITLVLGIISVTFQLPLWIYYLIRPMVGFEGFSIGNEMALDPIVAILTLFATALAHLFYILNIVATALIYLDLNETKNSSGLFEGIQKLGTSHE